MLLNSTDILKSIQPYSGWEIKDDSLCKQFEFSNFKIAFSAMTYIAQVAEKMDHHPSWTNTYNKLDISLSTHSEGGITEKDIKLAKEIETIYTLLSKK